MVQQLIHKSRYRFFDPNENIIGSTNCNEYIPVYTLFQNIPNLNVAAGTFSYHIIGDVYQYYKPANTLDKLKNFDSLLRSFITYSDPGYLYLKIGEAEFQVYVSGGCLMDSNNNILLILTCKSDCVNQHGGPLSPNLIEDRDGNITYSKLRVFVSTELLKNPIYKNFYKRLDKELLQFFVNNDIDMLYTSSEKIDKELYKNNFNITFDSITELQNILRSNVGSILFENIYLEAEPVNEGQGITTMMENSENINDVDYIFDDDTF